MEEVREKSFREALRKAVSKCLMTNQVVVPVYSDLQKFAHEVKHDPAVPLQLLIIDKTNAEQAAPMQKTKSRGLKVFSNTEKGYYAYAAVSNGEIIGDVWCAAPARIKCTPIHPDLPWLGITCANDEAYMFDLYVYPDSRGKVAASFLLGSALHHLKESGHKRSYGFYEVDNLPALWIHRLFGYSELGKRRSYRFLFYKRTEVLTGE